MRTLDEVIAELEDEGLFADALHYLLEYRMMKDDIVAKRKTLEEKISHYCDLIKIETDHYARSKVRWAEEYKNIKDDYEALQDFWAEQQANPPLTFDELRQMEGKPVWYEHEFWKGWIILGKVEQGVKCEMIPDREEKWYIVKDGSAKAYRKERE